MCLVGAVGTAAYHAAKRWMDSGGLWPASQEADLRGTVGARETAIPGVRNETGSEYHPSIRAITSQSDLFLGLERSERSDVAIRSGQAMNGLAVPMLARADPKRSTYLEVGNTHEVPLRCCLKTQERAGV